MAEDQDRTNDEFLEAVKQATPAVHEAVSGAFLLYPLNDFAEIESIRRLAPGFASRSAVSLQANLESAINVASVPYALCLDAALGRQFELLRMAELIRAGAPDGKVSAKKEEEISEKIKQKVHGAINSVEGQSNVMSQTELRLFRWLNNGGDRVAQELLLSTILHIWGAFETFVSELFQDMFDSHPGLASAITSDPAAKRHFPKGVSLEQLSESNFDLSESLGKVMFGELDFSSLPLIRNLCDAVLGASVPLREKLNDPELWLLFQRRHLIAHRRGIVDVAYLKKTSEDLPIGERLRLDAAYVLSAFALVRDTAIEMLKSAPGFDSGGKPESGEKT